MAGWKLRKDKAPADAAGTETTAAATAEAPLEAPTLEEPIALEPLSALPDFDAEPDFHFTDIDFDSDFNPVKPDADTAAKAEEDGALTLVDYSEHEPLSLENHPLEAHALESDPAESHAGETLTAEAPEWELPPPIAWDARPPIIAEPALEVPPPAAPDDFAQRLRADRSTPAYSGNGATANGTSPNGTKTKSVAAPSFSIPSVAPFVLDTPATTTGPAAAPQLVVRIGRLSAMFALTKDVTTIGRPDSILHSYPDVEIEMDDAVSRRHAEIVKRDAGFYLADVGSTNGTMLNGERLPPREERLLAHGDRIRVGDRTEIIFE